MQTASGENDNNGLHTDHTFDYLAIIQLNKENYMAKHDVAIHIPQRPLGKADVEFVVRSGGSVFGKLAISNGSIVWFPKGRTIGVEIGWQRFDKVMQENAIKFERRK